MPNKIKLSELYLFQYISFLTFYSFYTCIGALTYRYYTLGMMFSTFQSLMILFMLGVAIGVLIASVFIKMFKIYDALIFTLITEFVIVFVAILISANHYLIYHGICFFWGIASGICIFYVNKIIRLSYTLTKIEDSQVFKLTIYRILLSLVLPSFGMLLSLINIKLIDVFNCLFIMIAIYSLIRMKPTAKCNVVSDNIQFSSLLDGFYAIFLRPKNIYYMLLFSIVFAYLIYFKSFAVMLLISLTNSKNLLLITLFYLLFELISLIVVYYRVISLGTRAIKPRIYLMRVFLFVLLLGLSIYFFNNLSAVQVVWVALVYVIVNILFNELFFIFYFKNAQFTIRYNNLAVLFYLSIRYVITALIYIQFDIDYSIVSINQFAKYISIFCTLVFISCLLNKKLFSDIRLNN